MYGSYGSEISISKNSQEETIEGFRIHRSSSKKLHDFLEAEGVSKKKWLETKIDNDLDTKVLSSVKKEGIFVSKKHYALLFNEYPIEHIVDYVYNEILSLAEKNATWKNYLQLLTSFCNTGNFELEIDEESTFTTINLQHDISEGFTDIMELVWKRIANSTKEVKFENCIKTNISIIIKFGKL